MNLHHLAVDLRNAYEAKDRDALERALGRLTTLRTPPDLNTLTREQLEARRNEIHVQLASVNYALQKQADARRGQPQPHITPEEFASLRASQMFPKELSSIEHSDPDGISPIG